MGASRYGNLRAIVKPTRDRGVLGGGYLKTVQGDRAGYAAGDKDILIIPRETGQGSADGIGSVELIQRRDGDHRGIGIVIGPRVILGSPV